MQKALTVAILAAAPSLFLSACNGPPNGTNGVSPLPNVAEARGRLRANDLSANDLHAGGATFPAFAYNLASQPAGLATGSQAAPGAGSLFATIKFSNGAVIYYCLTGSGTGVGIFTVGSKAQSGGGTATTTGACAPLGATPTGFGARQDPPDFAGSDAALASTDYTAYKSVREPSSGTNYGEPFELPVIGGPIVYGYRPQDFPGLSKRIHLSQWSYCAIANGTISDWNDPAITKDNGSSITGGISRPITFFFRSDGSGTTYNFTFHLSTVCHGPWAKPWNAAPYESSGRTAAWPYGISKIWPGPGSASVPNARFIGENGNPGVLAAIQGTAYSDGYVEGAYAKSASPAVSQAILQSGNSSGKAIWSDPTIATNTKNALSVVTSASITYGGGSDGISLATSRPECILYIDPSKFTNPVANGAPTGSYPIMAISYLLFYQHQHGVHFSQKSQLINFMLGSTAKKIESGFEYTPLSSTVLSAGLTAKKGTSTKRPCLQT